MASTLTERQEIHNRLLAYAHPRRWAIFTFLTERVASPAEIAVGLGLDRKEVSDVDYHTKYLVEKDCAELVEEDRSGPFPVKRYKATDRAMIATEEWEAFMKENPALAKFFLGMFMQSQLDDYLLALKEGTVGSDENFHMSRTPRVLDEEGVLKGMEIRERSCREMDEVEREAAERRSESGEDAIHVSDGIAFFKVPARGA